MNTELNWLVFSSLFIKAGKFSIQTFRFLNSWLYSIYIFVVVNLFFTSLLHVFSEQKSPTACKKVK